MKKVLSILLIMAMVFCFAACGESGSDEGSLAGSMLDANPINEFVEGATIIDYNGITVTAGSWEDNGNVKIELNTKNTTDEDYDLMVKTEINGFPIHAFSTNGLMAGNEVGYFCPISTDLVKAFGIENIGVICFTTSVGKCDEETGVFNSEYESEVFSINLGNVDEMDTELTKGTLSYDADGLKITTAFVESDLYTSLALAFDNANDAEKSFAIEKLVVNGEEQNVEAYATYGPKTIANGNLFAILPLSNYTFDSETYETTKIDIESLAVVFNVDGASSDVIVLK